MRRMLACSFFAAIMGCAYVFGAYSFALDLWPIRQIRNLKRDAVGQARVVTQFDAFGRLVAWPDKQQIACPAQDDRTAVILFIGQSIQSNDAGQRYASQHGENVAAWFDGHCAIAQSPLLGATGDKGEPLTPIGDLLVKSGAYDRVVLIPSAIGGTALSRWAAGGDLHAMLGKVLDRVRPEYRVTHIVWHQGEDDFSHGSSTTAYVQGFNTLVDMVRQHGVDAPIFVSVATRCDDDSKWTPDNPVANAQRALHDVKRGLYAGVDTDALLQPIDRFDACHLGATGIEKYAFAVSETLRRAH